MYYKNFDLLHLESLQKCYENGKNHKNRTGIDDSKIFVHNERFDPFDTNTYGMYVNSKHRYNFPLLTIRNTSPRIAFWELLWMLNGNTDVSFLQDKGIHIWDGNSTKEYLANYGKSHIKPNTIGKGYGHQFRDFNGIDQLANTFDSLKNDPFGRRHMINLWNPADFDDMALHPCHYCYTFDVEFDEIEGEYVLNLHQSIRSNDAVLGSPYNKMFATFFLVFMAEALGYKVGKLATTITNFHIYQNHMPVVKKMLEVKDLERFSNDTPKAYLSVEKELKSLDDILTLTEDDITIERIINNRNGDTSPFFRFNKTDLPMAV